MLAAHADELHERFGVTSLALYGRAARDEAAEMREADLLVELDRPASFSLLYDAEEFLEDLTGLDPVRLAEIDMIHPAERSEVLTEAIRVQPRAAAPNPDNAGSCPCHPGRIRAAPRRQQVLDTLAAHRTELRERFGVSSVALFGSVARDEATELSDVDVLVEFDRPIGLFEVFDVRRYLRALLGVKVDVVLPDEIRPELRDDILREAIRAATSLSGRSAFGEPSTSSSCPSSPNSKPF